MVIELIRFAHFFLGCIRRRRRLSDPVRWCQPAAPWENRGTPLRSARLLGDGDRVSAPEGQRLCGIGAADYPARCRRRPAPSALPLAERLPAWGCGRLTEWASC